MIQLIYAMYIFDIGATGMNVYRMVWLVYSGSKPSSEEPRSGFGLDPDTCSLHRSASVKSSRNKRHMIQSVPSQASTLERL